MLRAFKKNLKWWAHRRQMERATLSPVYLWLFYGHLKHYKLLKSLYTLVTNSRFSQDWEKDYAIFWDFYWVAPLDFQPCLVSHYARTIGLKEGDPFCMQHEDPTLKSGGRIWTYTDVTAWGLPCGQVWEWLLAAYPHRLETTFLLASYSYSEMQAELMRLHAALDESERPQLFAMLTTGMLFRMAFEQYRQDFGAESELWKSMYAAWDMDAKLYLLRAMMSFNSDLNKEIFYTWAPDLFPGSEKILDISRALNTHPAKTLQDWYERQGHEVVPEASYSTEGLL